MTIKKENSHEKEKTKTTESACLPLQVLSGVEVSTSLQSSLESSAEPVLLGPPRILNALTHHFRVVVDVEGRVEDGTVSQVTGVSCV